MQFPTFPARNLEPGELKELVELVAHEPEAWREHAVAREGTRHFESLYRDDHVDIWVLTWTPGGDTGWHDHDISSGAVHVVEGALRESHPRMGGAPAERIVSAGSSFCFGSEYIHRLSGHAEHSVSIHAYSPPLWRLGQYTVDTDGVMRRLSVSYADELRPLDAPVAA